MSEAKIEKASQPEMEALEIDWFLEKLREAVEQSRSHPELGDALEQLGLQATFTSDVRPFHRQKLTLMNILESILELGSDALAQTLGNSFFPLYTYAAAECEVLHIHSLEE